METGDDKKEESVPPYPVPSGVIPCTHKSLEIRYVEASGRGLYATQDIGPHETIDVSPLLVFSTSQIQNTPLLHYTYVLPGGQQGLALGLGSLFNHSPDPNVGWYMNRQEGYIKYVTTKPIQKGQEACISYGHDVSWMDTHTQTHQSVVQEEQETEEQVIKMMSMIE